MKAATHPNYSEVRVQCACGHSFLTRSTHHGDIHVEICSNCHPFFTGKQREIDTAGRISASVVSTPRLEEVARAAGNILIRKKASVKAEAFLCLWSRGLHRHGAGVA